MASLKSEDKFLAEPDVQARTSARRARRADAKVSSAAPDVFDDASFSGDLLGCFAVFDGHVNASASSHCEQKMLGALLDAGADAPGSPLETACVAAFRAVERSFARSKRSPLLNLCLPAAGAADVQGGSTAVVVCVQRRRGGAVPGAKATNRGAKFEQPARIDVVAANAGDSGALLVRRDADVEPNDPLGENTSDASDLGDDSDAPRSRESAAHRNESSREGGHRFGRLVSGEAAIVLDAESARASRRGVRRAPADAIETGASSSPPSSPDRDRPRGMGASARSRASKPHLNQGLFQRLTREHNPDDPLEAKRLVSLGARLGRMRQGGREVGPMRCYPGGLAVSRAIGDMGSKPAVTCDPECTRMTLPARGGRLILASDGLWNAMTDRAAALTAAKAKTPEAAADALMRAAVKARGLHDDITIVCVDLPPPAEMLLAAEKMQPDRRTSASRSATGPAGDDRGVLAAAAARKKASSGPLLSPGAPLPTIPGSPPSSFTREPRPSMDAVVNPHVPEASVRPQRTRIEADVTVRRGLHLEDDDDSSENNADGKARAYEYNGDEGGTPTGGGGDAPRRDAASRGNGESAANASRVRKKYASSGLACCFFGASSEGAEGGLVGGRSRVRSGGGHFGKASDLESTLYDDVEASSGTCLRDVYELGALLGRGQYGSVRSATLRRTGETRAVKSIAADGTKRAQERIRDEIDAMLAVSGRHPNVPTIYRAFEERSRRIFHIVTEKYDGGKLLDAIGRRERFVASDWEHIAAQLLGACAFMHAVGVVHRDVKPDNVMLRRRWADGEAPSLVVVDFGSAAFCRGGKCDLAGFEGSKFFAAPEVLRSKPYGAKSDVWSCAVTLLVLLAGLPPNDRLESVHRALVVDAALPRLPRTAPRRFEAFLRETLVVDPDERPSAAEALRRNAWLLRSEDLDNRASAQNAKNGDRSEERAPGVVEDEHSASDDSSAPLDHSKRRATLDAVRARFDRSAAFILSVVLDAKSARGVVARLRRRDENGFGPFEDGDSVPATTLEAALWAAGAKEAAIQLELLRAQTTAAAVAETTRGGGKGGGGGDEEEGPGGTTLGGGARATRSRGSSRESSQKAKLVLRSDSPPPLLGEGGAADPDVVSSRLGSARKAAVVSNDTAATAPSRSASPPLPPGTGTGNQPGAKTHRRRSSRHSFSFSAADNLAVAMSSLVSLAELHARHRRVFEAVTAPGSSQRVALLTDQQISPSSGADEEEEEGEDIGDEEAGEDRRGKKGHRLRRSGSDATFAGDGGGGGGKGGGARSTRRLNSESSVHQGMLMGMLARSESKAALDFETGSDPTTTRGAGSSDDADASGSGSGRRSFFSRGSGSGGGNANVSASVRGASWLARAFSFSRSVSSSRLSRAEQSIRRGASWAPNRREEEEEGEEEEGEEAAGLGGDGKDETEGSGSAARPDPWAAAAAARPGELLSDGAAMSIVAADAGLLGPPGSREGSGGGRPGGASWWNEMTEHEVRGGAGALAALGAAAAAAAAEGNDRSGSGKSRGSGGRA